MIIEIFILVYDWKNEILNMVIGISFRDFML